MASLNKHRARSALLILAGLILSLQVLLLIAALRHEREDITLQRYAQPCRDTLQKLRQHPAREDHANCTIRAWYLKQLQTIAGLAAQIDAEGGSVAQQAQCAFGVRHQARISARAMMSSPLQVALLRVRDFYVYGHFDGPEFAQLIGADPARSDYERMLTEATTTNEQVNAQCQLNVDAAPEGARLE